MLSSFKPGHDDLIASVVIFVPLSIIDFPLVPVLVRSNVTQDRESQPQGFMTRPYVHLPGFSGFGQKSSRLGLRFTVIHVAKVKSRGDAVCRYLVRSEIIESTIGAKENHPV